MMRRARRLASLCGLAATLGMTALPVHAQAQAPHRTETATYLSAPDGMELSGTLTLPAGAGPHPGVVVLSVAGTHPLVDRLVGQGYAVLTPTLRGFVAVEPLLQATFADLAADLRAALDHLAARPEVDGSALGLIAQSDNAPPAVLAAAETGVPLILLAPPGFEGTEVFRLEQRWLAERAGARPSELTELDRYVAGIAEIALGDRAPYAKEYLLQGLRASARVDLPLNASFPSDERQAHFFASPLWHDRLAFRPEAALADLDAPVLILIGSEDPNVPMDSYAAAMQRGLAAARTADATLCRIPGRTRHTFSDAAMTVMMGWMAERIPGGREGADAPDADPRAGCLADAPEAP